MIFKEDIFIGKALHFRAIPQCSQMYTTECVPKKVPLTLPVYFLTTL